MSMPRSLARAAGATYLVAATSFVAVFGWLAAHFGYPDVLHGAAGDVLGRLAALGTTGRAVWAAYAVLPLLLVPAALWLRPVLAAHAPGAMRAATVLQVVAAMSMTLGLARWSSLHWTLAQAWPGATAEGQQLIATAFDAANLYLGNWIGEFLGEVALYAALALVGRALAAQPDAGRGVRGVAALLVLTGMVGEVASVRNVTAVVAPAAELANGLLPLALIALGVVLVAPQRRQADTSRAVAA